MTSVSPVNTVAAHAADSPNGGSVSPRLATPPKNVAFVLLFLETSRCRARLPMRVQIFPHDTTDSIVTTVKNFYGLYSGPTGSKGVSFEDEHGNTLIARYENFRNNMVVYIRVIEEPPVIAGTIGQQSTFHQAPMGIMADSYDEHDGHQQQPQPHHFAQDIGRPSSRTSRRRSPSPSSGLCRGSDSAGAGERLGRSQSARDRRTASHHSQVDAYNDSLNGYSSGDGAPSSSSGKAKEQLGNTDISVENIVEGGRRKRAKFESSELPLFAPPQMPAASSNPSVSPARRIEHQRPSLPFVHPGQHPFANPRSMQSPQSYNNGHASLYATPAHGHRSRDSIGYASNGSAVGSAMGVLPTPDPTVGSCMSEEDKDVAIQLMRLGEMSNISHGRTSASTLDDTFSGRADAASSTGATSDGENCSGDEMPAPRRQRLDSNGATRLIYQSTETPFNPITECADTSGDDADDDGLAHGAQPGLVKPAPTKGKANASKQKTSTSGSKSASQKMAKAPRPSSNSKTKKATASIPGAAMAAGAAPVMGPMSPASTTHSRKPSIASVGHNGHAGEDDQPDLSTKPRCQRCRKSKKGCDRQRPCGRCRDAGLSADQCISEDEGNGRKGRYGRHMGVPIKTEVLTAPSQPALLPAAPITTAAMAADKAKKRKR